MVNVKMGYGEDIAYIHDSAFTGLARSAATTALALLRAANIRQGLIIDLGCGSGIFAARLTSAGYEVLGIDMSDSMLNLARRRAPKAKFVRGSLFRAKLPACVAVTAIGESINYLFEETASQGLAALFSRINRALRPGGLFMFDIATPRQTSSRLCSIGSDWAVLVHNTVLPRQRLLARKMTIFRQAGELYRRSEETHRQRLYHPEAIASQLRIRGFRVSRFSAYQSEPLPPGRAGFLARKP